MVIVTGGSRGIGAATCVLLAERGWDIVVGYETDEQAALAVAATCREHGVRAIVARADVSVEREVEQLFAAADVLGTITGLVCAAGISGGIARIGEVSAEAVGRVLAVNVLGAFLCTRAAVRRMSTAYGGAGGSIVHLSSRAAELGSPGEFVHYAASKAAVTGLTLGAGRELATEGVRVNAVAVGLVDTDFHMATGDPARADRIRPTVPMQRSGTVEEVANAVAWLLSDEASYTTASVLAVSGGR